MEFSDILGIGLRLISSKQAVQAGIIRGYVDGTFGPNAEITRAEMASMIAIALGHSIEANAETGFADDKDVPARAKGSIAYMKKAGIMHK
jgi:hypothetical protein